MNRRQSIGKLIKFYFTAIYLLTVNINNLQTNFSLDIANHHTMKTQTEEAQCILKFSV